MPTENKLINIFRYAYAFYKCVYVWMYVCRTVVEYAAWVEQGMCVYDSSARWFRGQVPESWEMELYFSGLFIPHIQ